MEEAKTFVQQLKFQPSQHLCSIQVEFSLIPQVWQRSCVCAAYVVLNYIVVGAVHIDRECDSISSSHRLIFWARERHAGHDSRLHFSSACESGP